MVVQHTKVHFVGRIYSVQLGGTYTENPCSNSAKFFNMHLVKT